MEQKQEILKKLDEQIHKLVCEQAISELFEVKDDDGLRYANLINKVVALLRSEPAYLDDNPIRKRAKVNEEEKSDGQQTFTPNNFDTKSFGITVKEMMEKIPKFVNEVLRELDGNDEKNNTLSFIDRLVDLLKEQRVILDGSATSILNTLTVEEKVLLNPLLVTKILSYLETDNLKICRQINNSWNCLSNETLIKRKSLKLTLQYDTKYEWYFIKMKDKITSKTLRAVNKKLKKSAGFPCTNLCIKGKHVIDEDMETFLSSWRSQLKGFEWYNENCTTMREDLDVFRKFLVDGVPNIEYLYLEDTSSWDTLYEHGSFGSIKLPNLMTLHLHQNQENLTFMKEILQASTNLQKFIYDYDDDIVNWVSHSEVAVLMDTNKQRLIQGIAAGYLSEDIELWERLAKSNSPVQLKKLALRSSEDWDQIETNSKQRVASAFTKILKSSSTTMGTLITDFKCSCNLKFPIMSALEEFNFNWNPQESDRALMFPNNLQPSVNFPAVNKLTLEFNSEDPEYIDSFPFIYKMTNVTHLTLNSLPNADWLENFSEVFPCLMSLDVKSKELFPAVCEQIWTYFDRLEKLRLQLSCGYEYTNYRSSELDATLTGFSELTCRRLKKDVSSISNVEEMRTNPSILNLTGLKELNIFICIEDHESDHPEDIFTEVTGQFAFAKMPQLKVKIIGENIVDPDYFEAVLDPLSPFAEIIINE